METKMTASKKPNAPAPAAVTDELDQIMSEIEELQQEMATIGAAEAEVEVSNLKAVPTPEAMVETVTEDNSLSEFHASSGDASMEETLADLKDDSPNTGGGLLDQVVSESVVEEAATEEAATEEAVAEETAIEEMVEEVYEEPVQEEVTSVRSKPMPQSIHEEGTLTMTLTGNMTLKLKYEYEGQEVIVGFHDQSLHVQLADGTEFKIPLHRTQALRRVA